MTERGCLVVGDISGYTKFLTGVELEHSTDILSDVLGVVVDAMAGRFQLAKLEGDAVFVHARDDGTLGTAYFAAIESCHVAFSDRLWNIARATTCNCRACARLPELGLKFVVHYGEYAMHTVAHLTELVGSEVIRVHRLLKNNVRETTGIRDYAFFTRAFVERFALQEAAANMIAYREQTDDVGTVEGSVLDLTKRLENDRARRSIIVEQTGSTELPIEVDVPPAIAWDYGTSPDKQILWLADEERHEFVDGIPGAGMRTHCVHGDVTLVHEVLDWKPFRYLTYRSTTPAGPFLVTDIYEPLEGGRRTRITMRARPDGGPEQAALLAEHRERLSLEILNGRLRLVSLLATVGRSHGDR